MTQEHENHLKQLELGAKQALENVSNGAQLEQWRVEYIGRKGALPAFLRNVKDLPAEQRAAAGAAGNVLRQQLEAAYQEKSQQYTTSNVNTTDSSLKPGPGHLHPISIAMRRTQQIFASMGFHIVDGPDVELAKNNFDQLNIPFEHPARAETDTFYLKGFPDLVLRTHVSSLQSRGVEEHNLTPPFKMMYAGATYRSEKEDATHSSVFYQYEFMIVDNSANLSTLKSIATTFYTLFFGKEVEIRFRPSFFPFVEPGLEVDMRDAVTGKGQWLELAGAGMVHPNVLRNINLDPDVYQGIALGGGLDRLVMLQHNIPDIRLLYGGDIRFLRQFS